MAAPLVSGLVAFGVWWYVHATTPLARVRARCGDSYKSDGTRHGGRHAAATCAFKERGHDVSIQLATIGNRIVYLRMRVSHGKSETESLREHALAILDPVLDGSQRDAAARLLATVEPAHAGARRQTIDGAVVEGALRLWINAPERRYVDLMYTSEPEYFAEAEPVFVGWPEGLAPMTPSTVTALEAWCRDQHASWSTGDLWLTCEASPLKVQVIWNPNRRVSTIVVQSPRAAIEAVLDRVARPLLPEAGRDLLAPGGRAEFGDADHVRVTAREDDAFSDITIQAQ